MKVPYAPGCAYSIILQLVERCFHVRYAIKEAKRQNPVLAVYVPEV
ncbi:MAG: hypothetical protein Q8907_13340 [Bacteroidota bacterium]|nr:hypothetical protein [Bacteroidota bacterium]MDP4275255.1 hypothetical protein [Bacteroidota bacterium]